MLYMDDMDALLCTGVFINTVNFGRCIESAFISTLHFVIYYDIFYLDLLLYEFKLLVEPYALPKFV